MASNFATSFPNSTRNASLSSCQESDNMMDLDAIIQQLGQLESQLSYRESEIQAATSASRIAQKSSELDRELNNVLQELNDLESGNGFLDNNFEYGVGELHSLRSSDDNGCFQDAFLTYEEVEPSLHHSESKNSFGTLLSQSSHSSGASTGSGKSTQSLVRVYSPDGSSKTVAVDEQTTVRKLCRVLAQKHRVALSLNWAIVEYLPVLHIERMLEDHLLLMDQLNLWTKDSQNRLIFVERPEKFSIFNDKELRESAANNSFSPAVDGFLHLKLDGKKTWKRLYFVLRASGLYYNPKGKGKAASDLICLQPLKGVDFYFGLDWRKNYRAPTDFGFALKLPMVQKEVPKFIRFFCVEDKKSLMDWVTAFRLVKHGHQLYESFVDAQSWIAASKEEQRLKAKSNDTAEIPECSRPHLLVDVSQHVDCNRTPDLESEMVLTPTRKNSTEYGTLKKSVPNLPITTSLTRHLSMQHQNYVQTLPRPVAKSPMPGFSEEYQEYQPALPSKDGNFMRFPSPDFSLDQQTVDSYGYEFQDKTATLPQRGQNRLPLHAQHVRNHSIQYKSNAQNSSRPTSPYVDRAPSSRLPSSARSPVPRSPTSPSSFLPSPNSSTPYVASVQMTPNSGGKMLGNHATYPNVSSFPEFSLPLPPPPPSSLIQTACSDAIASNQDLPLPPPPPLELLSLSFGSVQRNLAGVLGSPQLEKNPMNRNPNEGNQPTSPPAPPTRSAETRLSFRRNNPRTQHIIRDFDRVMIQKQEQGADGLAHLEIPLPPLPSFDENYPEFVEPFDLPPPPAEILESLKYLRNRPLPPLPQGAPLLPPPVFSKVI